MGNLELSDRRDLQSFLTPKKWEKMISIWNQNNKVQISFYTHPILCKLETVSG